MRCYFRERRAIANCGIIACSLLALNDHSSQSALRAIADDPSLANIVIVTEDTAVDSRGCDAISVHDVSNGNALYRGQTLISPGRLAVSSDLVTALATFPNGCLTNPRPGGRDECPAGLVSAIHSGGALSNWASGSVTGADFATFGGIAMLDSTHSFLVGTSNTFYPYPDSGTRMRQNRGQYAVTRFAQPIHPGNPDSIGPALDRFPMSSLAVEIIISPDQSTAHIVTADGYIESIATSTLQRTATAIEIPQIEGPFNRIFQKRIDFMHASISADGRYLFTNRGTTPEVIVADLDERTSWTISMASELTFVGGVAINHGWMNAGLVAIHGRDRVVVARFEPPRTLTAIVTIAIREPNRRSRGQDFDYTGPKYSIAWSGDGARLIAATDMGKADFVILDVDGMRSELNISNTITACAVGDLNYPNDIFTLNGLLTPPPTPTAATPPPSLTPTQPPPPATTPAPSATPTPSPTPTPPPPPTASPTTAPSPIYLPIALRTRCQAVQPHVDVALVIDASSSMEAAAPSGRSKLQAAVDAASAFVRRLDLAGGDQAAVVTFNASAIVREPLSGDALALDAALASITTAQLTRIDLGLARAREVLADGARRRAANRPVIILLTDGRSNPVAVSDAVAQADGAKRDGITVFTIGLGDDVEIEALAAMASERDYAFVAPDADELARIYRTIAAVLPCAGTGWP